MKISWRIIIFHYLGSSPLHFCGYSGSDIREAKTLINLLINNGAHVDDRDDRGNTPLLTACIGGNSDLMNLLIEFGADSHAKNLSKEGIIELSKFYNHPDITKKFSMLFESQHSETKDWLMWWCVIVGIYC